MVNMPDLKLNVFLHFYTLLYIADLNLNDFESNIVFLEPKCVQFKAQLYLIINHNYSVYKVYTRVIHTNLVSLHMKESPENRHMHH